MHKPLVHLVWMLLMFAPPAFAAEPALTLDQAIEAAKQHKNSIKDSDAINDKLFKPAMSSGSEFVTFDGETSFKANLVCASDAPVVRVTAFPVGNLQSVGELNIRVEYDRDLDGVMEGALTINNVGGICGNGFIRDCSPSGSWSKCRFCKWSYENGILQEQCDYGTSTQAAPIGPQGMLGCFCFNASCGSPAMSMLENILSFAATGVVNILREQNNLLVVTKSEFSLENMQLSYLGAKVSNCEEAGNDATVAGLTALMGRFDFPAAEAKAKAEADPDHPYNSAVAQFGSDTGTFSKCVIQARVGIENRRIEREVLLDFGIGVDADGGSKQCYWFRRGYCGTVFGETSSLSTCTGRIIPAALSDLCSQFVVNAGILDNITGISDYRATSGVANLIGCYGSENDSGDQLWEVKCRGEKQDDVFVCRSPSMSIAGEIIRNDPYNAALFQGCDEVMEPEDSCSTLEKRRMDGECSLHSEVLDGVYTLREGSGTGLTPAMSCKNTAGQNRNITVCEPWWKKERVYRCKGQENDFSNIKERAQYIGGNISYDETTNQWKQQGDLTWDEDGTAVTNVFDPNLTFMPNGDSCIPACRVQMPSRVTDIYIPGQGKLASDGSYHMPYEGELSYTLNRETVQQSVRECEAEKNGAYKCPLYQDETMVSGCECFDQGAFGQVVSALAAIDLASTNMICSTGQNVGVCTVEDAGGTSGDQVYCGDMTLNPDGSITAASDESLKRCDPKLWRGTTASNQTHQVTITTDYRCHVSAVGLQEDDHFDNDLGALTPQSSWFDGIAATATSHIRSLLESDKSFIPDPEPGCICAANSSAACSWISQTEETSLQRQNALAFNAGHIEPFGAVYFNVVHNGHWEGVLNGKTTQCGTHTRNLQFRLTIRKAETGFIAALDQNKPDLRQLRTWPFRDTSLFLQQCVQRYTEPYADFTDPVTNGRFRATYLDLLAYQVAATKGELPRNNQTWSLPNYPPTYRPAYSIGEVEMSVLPNVPMFWDAVASPAYSADTWLGRASLTVSSLTPYAYYYECPLSSPVKSATNTCGAVNPFGGVDQTIGGSYCFKHRCDAKAIMEPETLTGCGMVNDANWQ